MRDKHQFVVLLAVGMLLSFPRAQKGESNDHHEQREFSMEQQVVPIAKPIVLPDTAFRALEKDPAVSSCLGNENPSRGGAPVSWFVASEIHLAGGDKPDLIVLPAEMKASAPMQPVPNACFLGPYTSKWWVLRRTPDGYDVVLCVDAHDVQVRQTRSNGYLDIEAAIASLQGTTTTLYKFDGKQYKRYTEKTEARPRTSRPMAPRTESPLCF
jgi:hypothetical protein